MCVSGFYLVGSCYIVVSVGFCGVVVLVFVLWFELLWLWLMYCGCVGRCCRFVFLVWGNVMRGVDFIRFCWYFE